MQRSVEDETILVVSYEGQHNHNNLSSNVELQEIAPLEQSHLLKTNPSKQSVALELSLSNSPRAYDQETTSSYDLQNLIKNVDEEIIKRYVISLTKDSNFSTAVAMAVARWMPAGNG